jgi:FeS assembly SUF system protein
MELMALESQVVEALRTVFDPEIPVNIYDLGLVYDIEISLDHKVRVLMTLTAPGCPVAGILPKAVERKVAEIPGVAAAQVDLVWEPTWTKEMMSEAARLELGLM